ncbi:calcium-responsive transcription factor-like [Plectropomus leopardus]|uniref:calcium-responsive transcription factor-like n=1 Tax=Plectropomus leopardus TaxID=160734 RepID=UPI001C4C9A5D|nr:calcium-responsive transcription factor-like [Plectropomus leopardus]
MADPSWLPSSFQILKKVSGYISGIVNSEEELENLLENHKRATLTSFNTWSRGLKDSSKLRTLWQVEDYSDDTPLCVTKRVILTCQHGKAPSKKTSTAKDHSLEYANTKKRSRVQRVKKLDCPAKLFIRYVKRYDTFSVKGDGSRARKEDAMKRLKQELARTNPPTTTFIHVKIPLAEAHQNHTTDLGCCQSRRIHPKVRDKIHEMVGRGITSVEFVKRALKQYVLADLCAHDLCKPHEEDKAYFPSKITIQNHIHLAIVSGHFSALGQEIMVDGDGDDESVADGYTEDENMVDGNEGGRKDDIVEGYREKSTSQCIKSAKLAFRKELKKLNDYSYLCEDLETLESSTEVLINLRKSFATKCRGEKIKTKS